MSTLRADSVASALSPSSLGSLDPAALASWLVRRRWFGAKAGRPRGARIGAVVPLPWDGGPYAMTLLEVDVERSAGDGHESHQYLLPLAVVAPDEAKVAGAFGEAIATVTLPDGERVLVDGVAAPGFRRALARALAKGGEFSGDDARLAAAVEQPGALANVDLDDVKVGSAEQSNTSLVVGGAAIVKLFRRLQQGEQPDVEVTRFLTRDAHFAHTPALLASLTLESGGDRYVAGMAQPFLTGSSDAWSWILSAGAGYFAKPVDEEAAFDLAADIEKLGRVTRAMHDALATPTNDPAFTAEPATRDDARAWASAAESQARHALDLLARALEVKATPFTRAEGEALVRRRANYEQAAAGLAAELGTDLGAKIRTHGDYHLGQVLRTSEGEFAVIDFEGEPARALDERRQKGSALRDVAGMLRSFAYAAATLGMNAKQIDPRTREVRMARWERDARAAFLRGYAAGHTRDDVASAQILPREASHVRALIGVFETEKVFYELAYELNNRPDWAWIPMRGVSKLLVR